MTENETYTVLSVFGSNLTKPSKDETSRQRIGERDIIIVRKGSDMARPGRKRKINVERMPDGRIRPPTMQVLNERNAADTMLTKAVVLAQPHRKGQDDTWLVSASGRFCRMTGCRRETFDGVEAFATMKRRWLSAMGKPHGFENATSVGNGEGPSAEQVIKWRKKIEEVEAALRAKFIAPVINLVFRIALNDTDLSPYEHSRYYVPVRAAFGEIAVCMGMLESNPHPFRG